MRTGLGLLAAATLVAACTDGASSSEHIPASMIGIHHRDSGGTAWNLEITGEGAARWQGDHCDYLDGEPELLLDIDGGDLALVAADGSPTFEFPGGTVQNVHVDEDAGGLRLTWTPTATPTAIETWPAGGVCVVCSGGSLVPTAPPTPCTEPFFDL